MDTPRGRKAKSTEDAKTFIRAFMDHTLNNTLETGYGKSYDFDLFLPWMMDWVLNVPAKEDDGFTPTDELEVLYMDAAWELVQEGVLRPGPRGTNGEGTGGEYGKGYAMTPKGRQWLKEFDREVYDRHGQTEPPIDMVSPSIEMHAPEPIGVNTALAE
jgi:hypothetical protein